MTDKEIKKAHLQRERTLDACRQKLPGKTDMEIIALALENLHRILAISENGDLAEYLNVYTAAYLASGITAYFDENDQLKISPPPDAQH